MNNRSIYILILMLVSYNGISQHLYLSHGSNFVVNGSAALVMNNVGLNNNGSFNPGSGTVYFSGNSDSTVSYITGDSTTYLTNFSVNKSDNAVAIKSPVKVINTLNMIDGDLYANSNLTLVSTVSNTARVTAVPASCHIYRKAIVERYIPSHRSWRLITAPVTDGNTIYSTWQNNGTYTPGRGMFVTGPNPTVQNGLDLSPQNLISLRTFNVATQTLVNVINTRTSVSRNNGNADNIGYFAFIRGDRSSVLFNYAYQERGSTTTISCMGDLQTGSQTFTASSTAGKYALIGNPYASPVDFDLLSRTNLVKRFYVWDSKINSAGAYVVLDDLDGDGNFSKSIGASHQSKEIQSGQAFFVQTMANGAASITFAESSKSSTNYNGVFKPLGETVSTFTSSLYLVNSNNSTVLADGAIVQFGNGFNKGFDWQDAAKFGNVNENLGVQNGKNLLSVERRPTIKTDDTLFLTLSKTVARDYQFEFIAEKMESSIGGFVEDKYLGTSQPIGMDGSTNKIKFTVGTDSASAATDRFRIVFKQAGVLPVTLTNVKAYLNNEEVAIEWNVENETNMNYYEVQKSIDGVHFTSITTVQAKANNNSSAFYNSKDLTLVAGVAFYRIKCTNMDSRIKFSDVVRVVNDKPISEIIVFPNPLKGGVMNMRYLNMPKGKYRFNLINNGGQVVYTKKDININNENVGQTYVLPELANGNYKLEVKSGENKKTIMSVIIQ